MPMDQDLRAARFALLGLSASIVQTSRNHVPKATSVCQGQTPEVTNKLALLVHMVNSNPCNRWEIVPTVLQGSSVEQQQQQIIQVLVRKGFGAKKEQLVVLLKMENHLEDAQREATTARKVHQRIYHAQLVIFQQAQG